MKRVRGISDLLILLRKGKSMEHLKDHEMKAVFGMAQRVQRMPASCLSVYVSLTLSHLRGPHQPSEGDPDLQAENELTCAQSAWHTRCRGDCKCPAESADTVHLVRRKRLSAEEALLAAYDFQCADGAEAAYDFAHSRIERGRAL